MTREEKQLLLKDLCARLPYGVKLGFANSNQILVPKEVNIRVMELSTYQTYPKSDNATIVHTYDVWCYRPYLRPMSSMTEEEEYEYNTAIDKDVAPERIVDWYYAHHLDFRGLIPMGLALEAPEGMYSTQY